MFCTNCGKEIADGQRFCTSCGAPAPVQTQTAPENNYQNNGVNDQTATPAGNAPESAVSSGSAPVYETGNTPVYNTQNAPVYNTQNAPVYNTQNPPAYNTPVYNAPAYNNNPYAGQSSKAGVGLMIGLLAGSFVLIIVAAVITTILSTRFTEKFYEEHPDAGAMDYDFNPDDYWDEDDLNIDWDSLNYDDWNLDYDTEGDTDEYDYSDYFDTEDSDIDDDYEYDDYTDSYSDGSNIIVNTYEYASYEILSDGSYIIRPKEGKVNSSTVLMKGKDLGGLLDYIDDTVLEKGRKINRDLLYDLVSTNIVDASLYSGNEVGLGYQLVNCLTVANEFYSTDARIISDTIDVNNASASSYNVKVYGKEDVWDIDFYNRTMYMNNGKTEYSSTMFDDETLAVWMVVVSEYYGFEF